jgi:hypothetical protein
MTSAFGRYSMQYKAVRIEILDANGQPVRPPNSTGSRVASGFLMQDGTETYLCTCWHVVTGIDLNHPLLPGPSAGPRRAKLRVSLQATKSYAGGLAIGGMESFMVDLLDFSTEPPTPLWEQDSRAVINTALAMANLEQPYWHDVIRLRVPSILQVADAQLLFTSDLWCGMAVPGDSVMVVGYPYGYSAMKNQPTPIVLRRSIAAVLRDGFRREVLLDGGGAGGMSGGPVFFIDPESERLHLYGIYTGIVFPDMLPATETDRTTALGTVCPLGLIANTGFSRRSTHQEPPR